MLPPDYSAPIPGGTESYTFPAYASVYDPESGGSAAAQWQTAAGFQGNPTAFDPTGEYSDPTGGLYKRYFRPQDFVQQFARSKAARDYVGVGGVARTLSVEGIRGGERRAVQDAKQSAASQGLGRGYAGQLEADITQESSQRASQALLGAELEERARRRDLAMQVVQSLIEGNKSRMAVFWHNKARRDAKSAAQLGLLGDIAGGLLGAGGAIGGAILGGGGGASSGGGG